MLEFPEHILNCVYRLREKYGARKSCVVMSYPIIEILKYTRDREISTKLFYDSSIGTFSIQASDEKFYPKISHYDFRGTERRWTRNKKLIFSLVIDLKKCGLWELISNKDYIVLNSLNKKIDPKELMEALEELTSI